ncbi:TetR/AcrR family transcriptional regulator [Pseudonocardia sp. KRD291]|uniref:TetR/AcrR family transcriptional regulator n=1 Tax=Pseudonocardia sp. KRD291 TaxID=2792007 RepID=UPI001C4A5013|nr:TetR/AcrR family transcriptional regulator [Pseudonocardia sp. KRD291]MBW0102698.1 TetR/AcrR family transcriptional regulator [Pseudonocardia sp. KRD291]
MTEPAGGGAPPKRADARRNEATILAAAADVFGASGVDAPIRDIAAQAGVGTATIGRHFPTRADLILALYRHQVRQLVEAGRTFSVTSASPHAALARWIDQFVDFVVTKQGLAGVLQSEDPCYDPLHAYFQEQLEPVCAQLLDAAVASGEIRPGHSPTEIMLAVGGLCAAASRAVEYDTRRMVGLLVAGLASPPVTSG